MTLYDEFTWRGIVYDATEGLADLFAKEHVTAYIGFDPTAASLHVGSLLPALRDYPDPAVWIHQQSGDVLLAQAEAVEQRRRAGEKLPLFGVPFAVKDNIDVAGLPTTAACPAFTYVPEQSAPVVQAIVDAGALLIGKTNLDQFGSGLAGDRSPYGACRNVFDPQCISGGSSSGSAVAVAAGLASFALGTDTAGSGRVPAGSRCR